MDTTMPTTTTKTTIAKPFIPQSRFMTGAQRVGGYLAEVWRRADHRPAALARIIAEMAVLRGFNGLPPSGYLLGHLDRPDIPWLEKWNHLGHRQYEEFVWHLNDPAYRKISQNKLAEKALLEAVGLPTPAFRGFFNDRTGRRPDGRPLRAARDIEGLFIDLMARNATRKFCFKELEGWAGSGFRAVEVWRIKDRVRITDLAKRSVGPMSVSEFLYSLDTDREYLIEDYIDQHPAYAEIHPTSINGYRFWVLNEGRGEAGVPFANLRFGRKGALVDNGTDRIMAPVDPNTGRIELGYEVTLDRPVFAAHPDTGVPLSGRTLPYFAEARQMAIDAMLVFPGMNFAGVDIAISETGPVVLELNNHPGGMGTLVGRKPMREVFTRALHSLKGEEQ